MHRFAPSALVLAALALATLATPAAAATWDIDTGHSMCGFVAKHLVFSKVHGRFEKWSGVVTLDDKDITKSHVEVKIDPATVNSENESRDKHLKSADFLDVEKFKELTFVSTSVAKGTEAGTLKITGDLTIHGVKKSVVLDVSGPSAEFKDPGGNAHLAFSGSTKINRKDFGLMWSKAVEASPIASDDINIELEIELYKKR